MKLLIADDEQYVRYSLTKEIDWAKYGIEVTGVASDGREAVELARSTRPDLLLTDIRMPLLSGLEVIKCLKSELPQMKVVLFSGWSDFEYAREGMKLGASNYLIKPCPDEEIVDALLVAAQDHPSVGSGKHSVPNPHGVAPAANESQTKRHAIKMACELIHFDLSRPITLTEVADKLDMNASSLSRLFRQEMGSSFSEYVTNARLNLAKKLLLESNLKIHDIAQNVGYGSVSHFVQVFGENAGMTPGTFRETYG